MKIVAALSDPALAAEAGEHGADLVELRLDLMNGDPSRILRQYRRDCTLPVIATIRSGSEGGQFFGNADAWMAKIRPVLQDADYIDVEQQFASHAPEIRAAGPKIIASHHTGEMPPLFSLFALERDLLIYGDIPKIIVTPANDADLIELITFTQAAPKPVITGIMGSRFRYGRAILPLFGAEFVYCHLGTRTAEGQYSVEEFITLMNLISQPG